MHFHPHKLVQSYIFIQINIIDIEKLQLEVRMKSFIYDDFNLLFNIQNKNEIVRKYICEVRISKVHKSYENSSSR